MPFLAEFSVTAQVRNRDFIATAEMLIKAGYTNPSKLGPGNKSFITNATCEGVSALWL